MIVPTRKDVMQKATAQGYKIAAVMPIHYPRAILRACGFHPMEVWGPPFINNREGTQHFPEYTCDIVQKAAYFLTHEHAAAIDLILIPHTCDSLQGMASIFMDFIKPKQPVLKIYHPRSHRASDAIYLEKEIKVLAAKLSEISGIKPTDNDILAVMTIENEANRIFADIAQRRKDFAVTDRTFYTFLRSREYLFAEQFIELSRELTAGKADLKGPGLMISGIVPEPMDLFDQINRFGAHVVIDDLACCSRRIYQTFNGDNPYKCLAQQLTSMPPDTTLSAPYKSRFEYLKGQVRKSGARGVLVYNVKFCEPELFYIPLFEKAMKEEGCPLLFIEGEMSTVIPGQVLNRINAFVEVLS